MASSKTKDNCKSEEDDPILQQERELFERMSKTSQAYSYSLANMLRKRQEQTEEGKDKGDLMLAAVESNSPVAESTPTTRRSQRAPRKRLHSE